MKTMREILEATAKRDALNEFINDNINPYATALHREKLSPTAPESVDGTDPVDTASVAPPKRNATRDKAIVAYLVWSWQDHNFNFHPTDDHIDELVNVLFKERATNNKNLMISIINDWLSTYYHPDNSTYSPQLVNAIMSELASDGAGIMAGDF